MNLNLTLIGQAISFAIFVWFCMRFVWPPVHEALAERQKKIAEGLDAAARAQRDLDLAQDAAQQRLREAKEQAAGILEQANRRGDRIVAEARDQARGEGERLKEAALAEIEQEKMRAKEELRAQVAALAIAGAEKILQRAVNDEVDQTLLDRLADEL